MFVRWCNGFAICAVDVLRRFCGLLLSYYFASCWDNFNGKPLSDLWNHWWINPKLLLTLFSFVSMLQLHNISHSQSTYKIFLQQSFVAFFFWDFLMRKINKTVDSTTTKKKYTVRCWGNMRQNISQINKKKNEKCLQLKRKKNWN